jgi:hypothetical protein
VGKARVGLFVLLSALILPTPVTAQILFVPQYTDGAGEGFNDATFGAARKAAFQATLTRIGGFFQPRFVGETVVIGAQFNPLGGSPSGAVLASAGPTTAHTGINNAPVAGVAYPSPLANHRHLSDVNGGTAEITIQFNTDVDNGTVLGSTNWYYGTDGLPGGHIDMISVAMHEIGHGLGFSRRMQSDGTYLSGVVGIYDHFMNTSATGGTKLRNLPTNAARADEAIGNDLWWDGAQGTAGNGGTRPKLYAPSTFAGGSSLSHLDETVHGNELMSPNYSGVDQFYSEMELGMLADMGWTIAPVPEPATVLLFAAAVGGGAWASRWRQRARS